MTEWVGKSLKDLSRIRRGASPRPIDDPRWFAAGGPGWVRISDVTSANGRLRQTEQYLSQDGAERSVRVGPGNVLMSICATIGEPVVVEMDACIHDGFVVFDQFGGKLDRQFLLHELRWLAPRLKARGQTGTQANLNTEIVGGCRVWLPENLEEQSRMAAVLDLVDEAIAKTEAVIAKLKQVRAGLLHDLLTRGLDENGELRDPVAHPEQFQQSQLGRTPRDWKVEPLGALFEMQLGKMLSPQAKSGVAAKPYVANRHVLWERVDCRDLEYMDFAPAERIKYALHAGDLLVCEGGEVGRTAMWRGEAPECYFQKAIHRLRPKRDIILPEYMVAFMRRTADLGGFVNLTSQTSIAHLTQEKLALLPVAYPLIAEQREMLRRWAVIDKDLETENSVLNKLGYVRVGLADDLLTGRVRVPEWLFAAEART